MNLLEDMNNPLWKSKKVIYCYTNKINGKKYIGQINGEKATLYKRHKNHMCSDLIIDKALMKYGIDNFSLEIIHFGETLDELNYFESFYIKYYNTLSVDNLGYNISDGGSNGNNFAGKTEKEMKEIGEKIRLKNKNYVPTEETKEKISKTMKERYSENHWMKGKKLSDETKRKLSEKSKGRVQSEESKQKISNANKGRKLTKEHKEKLSKAKNHKKQQIVSIDIDTKEIEFFNSISETKTKYGYSPTLIRQCCLYNNNKEEFVEKFGRTRLSAYNK